MWINIPYLHESYYGLRYPQHLMLMPCAMLFHPLGGKILSKMENPSIFKLKMRIRIRRKTNHFCPAGKWIHHVLKMYFRISILKNGRIFQHTCAGSASPVQQPLPRPQPSSQPQPFPMQAQQQPQLATGMPRCPNKNGGWKSLTT